MLSSLCRSKSYSFNLQLYLSSNKSSWRGSFRQRYSTAVAEESSRLQRAYLYVPSSSTRMLEKSVASNADTLIYDLEDSVAPAQKESSRTSLVRFLGGGSDTPKLPPSERLSVRVNAIDTPFFQEDIAAVLKVPIIQTLVLPKIHSTEDLDKMSQIISQCFSSRSTKTPIRVVASIESARSLWSLGDIATWRSREGVATVFALLFAAEDFCADTSIIRTSSREELLYPRSKIALATKAFQLQAIDMVCVNYKDKEILRQECEEGRRLGFNGKQAIHPDQVEIIQGTFVPTAKEIERAARILHQMQISHASSKGAIGLDLGDGKGGREMIDAPLIKQAIQTIRLAKAAGLEVPTVS
ncbi:Pyruvate/Phosphoenolpyruvate kinase-like domain-containing protein [Gautieria morchelliformis]|nr:Pyruvate/Phosphoenolpyruvate kinase-like domain-containing protein [Gautieria morchelliformis]